MIAFKLRMLDLLELFAFLSPNLLNAWFCARSRLSFISCMLLIIYKNIEILYTNY